MSAEEPQTFGSVVRAARIEHRMSLGQLAAGVDRTAASVRRWERDESVPSGEIRERLAELLDLDPDVLHELARNRSREPAEPDATSMPSATAELAAGEEEFEGEAAADPFVVGPTEAIAVPSPPPGGPDPEATTAASAPPGIPETEPATGMFGRLAELRRRLFDPDEPWLGYFRGVLTFLAFLVMAWVLVWALGRLGEALGAFFDSFRSAPGDPSAWVARPFS